MKMNIITQMIAYSFLTVKTGANRANNVDQQYCDVCTSLQHVGDVKKCWPTCFDKFVSQHLSCTGSSPAGSISRDLNSQKLHY